MANKIETEFVVIDSSAKMPGRCWGRYRRVAVLEVRKGWLTRLPSEISDRSLGVVRVVCTWEKCHVGKTDKDAYTSAWREARAMADEYNRRAEAEAEVANV